MRWGTFLHRVVVLAILAPMYAAGKLFAADPLNNDPLRWVPREANLCLKIENPRLLVETFLHHPLYQQLRKLEALQEIWESNSLRRFQQLIAYYERELGKPWPKLLDDLAGNGIVLAFNTQNEGPFLLVVQGRDANVLAQFKDLALQVLEQEVGRNEAKWVRKQATHRGVVGYQVAPEFYLAQHDQILLLSNRDTVLKMGIDLIVDATDKQNNSGRPSIVSAPELAQARRLLSEGEPDGKPLVWLYGNYGAFRQSPDGKNLFAQPRNDVVLTLLFGGWLDAMGRNDYVAAGLFHRGDTMKLAIRLPSGREGLQPEMAAFCAGEPGSLPLLEPKQVIFSHSFYWDLGALYDLREKLMPAGTAKDFESATKQASRFLPGTTLPDLLRGAGKYHRLVVAHQEKCGYQTEPKQRIPAFAFVTAYRDARFPKAMDALLRSAALLAGAQAQLKLQEVTYQGVKIVGYRFPEDKPFPGSDPDDLRFNFSPCYAQVNDQFLVCSTIEFCQQLIDYLKSHSQEKAQSPTMQMQFYSTGLTAFLRSQPDLLETAAVLQQAVPIEEARRQVKEVLAYLDRLGTLKFQADFRPKTFHWDMIWKSGP